MIEIQVNPDQMRRAIERSSLMPNDPSIPAPMFGADRQRILAGYLGEEIVADYLGVEVADEYDYDLVVAGQRIDVKTIGARRKPTRTYSATVNSWKDGGKHRQAADFYIFAQIHMVLGKCWIMGHIACEEFFRKATLVEKGKELCPGVPRAIASCHILPVYELIEARDGWGRTPGFPMQNSLAG